MVLDDAASRRRSGTPTLSRAHGGGGRGVLWNCGLTAWRCRAHARFGVGLTLEGTRVRGTSEPAEGRAPRARLRLRALVQRCFARPYRGLTHARHTDVRCIAGGDDWSGDAAREPVSEREHAHAGMPRDARHRDVHTTSETRPPPRAARGTRDTPGGRQPAPDTTAWADATRRIRVVSGSRRGIWHGGAARLGLTMWSAGSGGRDGAGQGTNLRHASRVTAVSIAN